MTKPALYVVLISKGSKFKYLFFPLDSALMLRDPQGFNYFTITQYSNKSILDHNCQHYKTSIYIHQKLES